MKKWFVKHQWPVIIFGGAALLILLAMASYAILYVIKDSRVQYAQSVGSIKTDDQPGQELAIVTYVQKHSKDNGIDAVCSAKVFGYDLKYIYGYTICSWTKKDGTSLGSGSDYSRYAYTGPSYTPVVVDTVSQGEDDVNPSLESIYPAKIYHIAMPHVAP